MGALSAFWSGLKEGMLLELGIMQEQVISTPEPVLNEPKPQPVEEKPNDKPVSRFSLLEID